MDIMNSKKTLLSLINGGALLGAPAAQSTVKFQYATNLATAATSETAGALTFAADANGNAAIFAQGTLVSSKIQNITTAVSGANGGKTVTISYVRMDEGHKGEIGISTFDVIDETGLESYFNNSSTLEYVAGTSGAADKFEVKLKTNGGIEVGEDGLYVDIEDVFGVDASTIGFIEGTTKLHSLLKLQYHAAVTEGTPKAAYIALEDKDGNSINEIPVQDIIGNGILKSVTYNKNTNQLILVFAQADGSEKTVTVDMKDLIDINDIFLDTEHDADDYLTLTNDTSIATFGVTDKTKNAVALAETALQGINKTETSKTYVDLTVGTKTTDGSTQSLEIVETNLVQKFTEVDGSIGDISTRLFNKTTEIDASITALKAKDVEIDSSINRLDTSVSNIETAIAAMDADVSTAVALDAQNGIYVRGTLSEANGIVTGITAATLIADTSITRYNKAGSINPAWELNSDGLLNGDAATKLKNYVDDVAAQLRDEAGAVDSSKSDADGANFISIHEEQVDGEITVFTVDSSYGAYGTVTRDAQNVASAAAATDGIAKVADTQTWVMGIVNGLDKAADAKSDASNFITTTISETDGIVSNDSVAVTYAEVTAAPGAITVSHNGIVKGDVLEAAIEGALTWTVLS